MKRALSIWSALLLASLVSVVANAQEGFTRQSFLPPEHGVDLTGMPARPMMVGLDVSTDTNNVPFHFPLHVYIGITDRLALGPIHEIGPFYPFGGLCPNCDHPYDDIGLGILYKIIGKPDFELDFNGDAPLFIGFADHVRMSVRGGVLGRVNFGRVFALVFDPSLQVGLVGRPPEQGNNKDYLWLPAWFYFQVTDKVAPFVGTGFGGQLEGFADSLDIPLEGGCIVSVTRNVDLGGVFQFYNLMGHGGNADGRQIGFLGRFRFGGR
ncbi:MAG TPA: hypothetical protein VLJ38_15095 [Polyangiaceae bacterium]|nr:hypothetical protein [Polyangiaceae bacterium]